MKQLSEWLSNRVVAWYIVAAVALLTAVSLFQVRGLDNEDDILAFMPQDNPDVRLFYDINKRFGGLDLALVGVSCPDAFDGDFLARLQKTTEELDEIPELGHVLSLTNVMDVTPDEEHGGVVTARLVQQPPRTEAEKRALREKVLSRDHVVGNLVGADGKAVLIYAFLAYGVEQRQVAGKIRDVVDAQLGTAGNQLFWGGQPFVSTYIYDTTQEDLRRLTPWAVLAIVLIMILAFRDLVGALLALVTTGIGIAITLGAMATFDVPFNIVLSAMPIILFAIGSAFGIHLMARYYVRHERGDRKALAHSLMGVGPTIAAAGLTTVVSLLSFVFMDIQPIRTFGFFTALGIFITLLLSLTFIPAVIRLTGLKRKPSDSILLKKLMVSLTVYSQKHRLAVGMVLLAIAGVSAGWISQVDTSVDNTTFFDAGSPPDLSDRFLKEQFGGSQFVQIHVEADMDDPHVLREVRRIADRIRMLPDVSSVQNYPDAVALTNEAMSGQRRIPDTRDQVCCLYQFLMDDPAVNQLVSTDRKMGLLHVKVSSNRSCDLHRVLHQVELIVSQHLIADYRIVRAGQPGWDRAQERKREMLLWRLQALAAQYDALPEQRDAYLKSVRALLAEPTPQADRDYLVARLTRFMRSEECAVQLDPPPPDGPGAELDAPRTRRVAEALAALKEGAGEQLIAESVRKTLELTAEDPLAEDLAFSVVTPLREFFKDGRAEKRLARLVASSGLRLPTGQKGERFEVALAGAMWDLDNSSVIEAAGERSASKIAMTANGLPVLQRGLSRSVEANQVKSLIFALVLIVIILAFLFRSLWSGLLAASPTIFTLAVVYGGMGMLGVHLDIGTSMLASIILGIGVDYAVHLVAAWRAPEGGTIVESAAAAADQSGPAIWTNAIMICVGFFVLTLGKARPLQNVGGLTAAAMLVAALATFLVIPALARKIRYRKAVKDDPGEEETSEAVVAVLNNYATK
ncbi:MAG: MMPL family transporter [Deltaproteobacteria bacterium]|nr:MMPL family transporter [Deltaproteobacteria bacterium]